MKKVTFQKLKKLLPNLKRDILLAKYTTFKIGGKAKFFLEIENKEELKKAIKVAKGFDLPFFILGEGSNLLISDKGYNGLIIKFQFSDLKLGKNEVNAGAGLKLEKLVNTLTQNGFSGLEWAGGIPGTVGGAVFGNISAFNGSIEKVLKRVEVFDTTTLKIKIFSKKDYKAEYKDSIFKQKRNLIILSATFQFSKGNKRRIKEKVKKYLNYRQEHHPLKFPSLGSIFKNPSADNLSKIKLTKTSNFKLLIFNNRIPAGFLIEKSGLKGKKIGRAQISKKHANFIINLGGAKAEDVIKLIRLIKKKVKDQFGLELEEEIQYLGFKNKIQK